MVEKKKISKRKKPKFLRRDWNKKIKLGSTVKKKRKWRAAKGRDNKMRLKERGYARRPAIGWRADKRIRGKVNGFDVRRVENLKGLEEVKKGEAIFIAKVGKKKKREIIKKANEMKILILNKYRIGGKLTVKKP